MDRQPLVLAKLAAAYLFAAGCLVWVLRDFPLSELPSHIRPVSWTWVGAAVACDVLSYLCQGFRWSLLLTPLGNLSWLKSTQAVYSGLFTNEILPFRLGEGMRGLMVSRWLGRTFAEVLPSMVLERIMDGVVLASAAILMSTGMPLPGQLGKAVGTLSIIVAALAAALVLLMMLKRRAGSAARWIGTMAQSFQAALSWKRASGAFSLSMAFLGLQAVSFWCAMESYGIHLPLWQGCAVLVIVRILTSVPGAPANLGTYQVACVLGLTLFGVGKEASTGFSIFGFLVLTVPLWTLGMLSLARSGMSLRTARAVEEPGPMVLSRVPGALN